MSRIIKYLFRLIALSALIYLAYTYTHKYIFPILLVIYLVIAGITLLSGIAMIRHGKRYNRRAKDDVIDNMTKKESLHNRIRFFFIGNLSTLINLLNWPGLFLYYLLHPIKQGRSIKKTLSDVDSRMVHHWVSINTFILLILFYLFTKTNGQGYGFGEVFLYALAIGILLKHSSYIIDKISLPRKLRRLSSKPYSLFIIILIFDFLSLVLVYSLISVSEKLYTISYVDIKNVVENLFTFQELVELFQGKSLSYDSILVSVSGFMFYTCLIGNILKYKEFQKDDEDYEWLMNKNNFQGKYTTSIMMYDKIKNKGDNAKQHKVIALLGNKDLESARKLLKKQLADTLNEDPTDYYFNLLGACAIYDFDVPIYIDLITEGIVLDVPDYLLMNAVVIINESENYYKKMIDVFIQFRDTYPLTLANLYLFGKDYENASRCLALSDSTLSVNIILKIAVELELEIKNNPEKVDIVEDWIESNYQFINTIEIDNLNKWESMAIFVRLIIIEKRLELVEDERCNIISEYILRLKERYADDIQTQEVFLAAERDVKKILK